MSSDLVPIESYSEAVMAFLASQYKGSPKLSGMIDSMNPLAQNLEQAIFEIRDLFWIRTAVGVQLDAIGALFGVERVGRLDEVYRQDILRTASATRSGTPEDVIASVKSLTGADSVIYVPQFPAGYWAVPIGGDASNLTQAFLDEISPAGVRGILPCYLSLESPPSGNPNEALLFEDGDWILIQGPCIGVVSDPPLSEASMIGDTIEPMMGEDTGLMVGTPQ